MFKVRYKKKKDSLEYTVYSVRINKIDDIEFLVYDRIWCWIEADDYEPVE